MSIMLEGTFRKVWPTKKLVASGVKLQKYFKEPLPVVGSQDVKVQYEGQSAILPLIVVKGNVPTLLGRNWLDTIKINWYDIHYTPSTGLQNGSLSNKNLCIVSRSSGHSLAWPPQVLLNRNILGCLLLPVIFSSTTILQNCIRIYFDFGLSSLETS